jgi:hypothetical protein
LVGREVDYIYFTASFTPLPAREGRAAGFGVILSGVKVTA